MDSLSAHRAAFTALRSVAKMLYHRRRLEHTRDGSAAPEKFWFELPRPYPSGMFQQTTRNFQLRGLLATVGQARIEELKKVEALEPGMGGFLGCVGSFLMLWLWNELTALAQRLPTSPARGP